MLLHAAARVVWGHAPQENFLKLHALRLFLRSFLAETATWIGLSIW